MARLHPAASGPKNVKCPQSTIRVTSQKPPTSSEDNEITYLSSLCFVPGETPNNGLKTGRAVYGPKYTTHPG